jgi:predicted dehydrogenase
VADAVTETGVVSQVVPTKRYHPSTRVFLAAARTFEAAGARSCYLHGAFLGGDFAAGWRFEHGALLDLGPHLLDLLDASVGPITGIRATGDPCRWVELTCEHENGAVSQASRQGLIDRATRD